MLDLPHTTIIEGNAVRWGKAGNGPPLVAIHGTPFSSQVWRRIVPPLADRRTVYYFDLVGYGLSEMREAQDVSLAVQNKTLAALFTHWGLERPDVLAHDFGGATALRAYYLNGLRYRSLTIFDAVAVAPWGCPFVQHVRKHESAFSEMPDYMHRALLRAIGEKQSAGFQAFGLAIVGHEQRPAVLDLPDLGQRHIVRTRGTESLRQRLALPIVRSQSI